MSKGNNSKRSRGRGNNARRSPRNQVVDSSGPEGRVRGNVQQVYDKYLSMARETVSTDRIVAENMFQHADHYFRVMKESEKDRENRKQQGGNQNPEEKSSGNDGGEKASPPQGRKTDSAPADRKKSPAQDDGPDGEELAGVLKEVPIKSGNSKGKKDKDGSDDDSEAAA